MTDRQQEDLIEAAKDILAYLECLETEVHPLNCDECRMIGLCAGFDSTREAGEYLITKMKDILEDIG